MYKKIEDCYRMSADNSADKCLICFRNIKAGANLYQLFVYDDVICCACRRLFKENVKNKMVNDLKILGIYSYNEWTSKLLIQYKELMDEALAPIFLYPFINRIKKQFSGYILIPIPSSKKKTEQRGFLPLKQMFNNCNLPLYELLEKMDDSDQKVKNRGERKKVKFQLKEMDLSNKKILLIDDVVTTGSSMKEAYRLLVNRCKKVKMLSVIICEVNR